MPPAVSPERPAEMNAVICIFNIDKEDFNGVSSIKTDIYFSLGFVWLTSRSIFWAGPFFLLQWFTIERDPSPYGSTEKAIKSAVTV